MYRLEEFEGDEMWDYEGWDFLSEETEPEEEIAWRTPIKKKSKSDGKSKTDSKSDKPKKTKAKKDKKKKVKS